ncbi:MAG: HNH endonuclease [Acidobacteria bacterium]|nr:HNH endonuclease [Acidobacteriota bacterium]
MANERRQYSKAEELELTTQVEGYCPLCDSPLFYQKRSKRYKGYELAHIYPLNPTSQELIELEGVEMLSQDVNHPDNIAPLCLRCHGQFDKPRTREEYEQLASAKRMVLSKAVQRALRNEHHLESEIGVIITKLHECELEGTDVALALDVKKADDKFDGTLPLLTRRKIKRDIEDYYNFVKSAFRELERRDPTASEMIFRQVRTFYLKQKKLGLPQAAVYTNVAEWVRLKSSACTLEAAEIVASFFVQNCEVFE